LPFDNLELRIFDLVDEEVVERHDGCRWWRTIYLRACLEKFTSRLGQLHEMIEDGMNCALQQWRKMRFKL
jgi:hypothetical protein